MAKRLTTSTGIPLHPPTAKIRPRVDRTGRRSGDLVAVRPAGWRWQPIPSRGRSNREWYWVVRCDAGHEGCQGELVVSTGNLPQQRRCAPCSYVVRAERMQGERLKRRCRSCGTTKRERFAADQATRCVRCAKRSGRNGTCDVHPDVARYSRRVSGNTWERYCPRCEPEPADSQEVR